MEPVSKEIIKDYWQSANPDIVMEILNGRTQVELPQTEEVRKYLKSIRVYARESLYYKSVIDELCKRNNTTPDKLLSIKEKGLDKGEKKGGKKGENRKLEDRVQSLEAEIRSLKMPKNTDITMKKDENMELALMLGNLFSKSDKDETTQKLIRQVNSSS